MSTWPAAKNLLGAWQVAGGTTQARALSPRVGLQKHPGGTGPEVCLNQLRPGATHSAQTCPLRDRNTCLTTKGLAVTTHTPGDLLSISLIFNVLNPHDLPLGGNHSPRLIGEETEAPRGLVNSRAVPRQASGRVGVGGQARSGSRVHSLTPAPSRLGQNWQRRCGSMTGTLGTPCTVTWAVLTIHRILATICSVPAKFVGL